MYLLKLGIAFVHSKLDPIGYALRLGVQLGRDVKFYGMKPFMFGSEPWLVRIGDQCHITSGCQFVTHDGGTLVIRWRDPTLEITAPIVMGSRVYVGINTIILPGVTIGDDVIIGAGSVVTRDIPSGSVAAGVPARVLKSTDEYFFQSKEKSLGLGHLPAAEKELALREFFMDFIGPQEEVTE
ncbi:acyltransferase [Nostocoides australiense]